MSAAILVIGNEVLSGGVKESNANFFIAELFKLGIRVRKVEIIPDIMEEIVDRIQVLSKNYEYLFVTGGIGATHDDLTREAVAKAVNQDFVMNKEAETILMSFYKDQILLNHLEAARLPKNCEIIVNHRKPVCYGFKGNNIFVYPGFPELLLDLFPVTIPYLKTGQLYKAEVKTDLYESQYADALTDIANRYPDMEIGSYPKLQPHPFKTLITVNGRDEKKVQECLQTIIRELKITPL